MAKPTPGLRKRGETWHIEKTIGGQRIFESTGETELDAAERYLARRIEQIRRITIYGERINYTFDQAAARYIEEEHKKSLDRDITTLTAIMPYIGALELSRIHSGSLDGFIKDRRRAGISAGTLTRDIAVVRRVLTLAARLWRDEQGRAWLDTVPLLPVPKGEKRKPRPISWSGQQAILKALPGYLSEMVLFALNTGMRDQEICGLRWDAECKVQGRDASVFIIEEDAAKNGHERIVPLNAVARAIVDSRRGKAGEFVFGYEGGKLGRMGGKAWSKGRKAVNLQGVRIHDLRHTFGMRLRAAGVSFEDRQDLLGHHAGRITTHYSKVEIANLIACVELLCEEKKKPELTLIRCA
ncbi:site-specific integrase [Methylococcus sp. EFPC2]|uniref:tyrosine-type recombinase/integrase n=1 Tax=Methylococcus sp. EFPC2 TaxID=2812648 RepID=UPI0019681FB1|nr:site-specific integrase [Methylococcus sp. EFPC2]QSA98481.1 site-specific integrase [Methylococcus sp. EFPC2]